MRGVSADSNAIWAPMQAHISSTFRDRFGIAVGLLPTRRGVPERRAGSGQRLERRPARISRLRSQLLLDPQQLVVLRDAVGARERAGLDLPAIGRDREVGDGRILGL